ncbi:hypothetical protein VTH06DRAFT_2966 [Thermothelomyces fergusii]
MHAFFDPASSELPNPKDSQNSHSRRMRPPDPQDEASEAVRMPLRLDLGDKPRRRESRLGLRNIFGRARGVSDADPGTAPSRDGSHKPGGIRASLAEIGWSHVSQNAQGHRSDVSLPAHKPSPVGNALKHKKSESLVRPQPSPEGTASWNPPPLFRAYPQAIKHAHLPACTLPAEAILRMHAHKNGGSLAGLLGPKLSDPSEDTAERLRSRQRSNGSVSPSKFEWTSKVYVLTSSRHLLQYAGEGTYDRLPEKVLQLGKDSAAFASDAIPGRHWVIQVTSSVPEPDRVPGPSSSLRARLPFLGHEKRHASALLMVCESAEEMEAWIATLRREIEALGGRKVLSETGTPKTDDEDVQLRSRASQKPLVWRNPDWSSRVATPDQFSSHSLPITSASPEANAREQSFDDNSTASFVSHEGRQLESLRDSYNRLSHASSGQRTMVTSVGSSPACSPVRDSFGDVEPMPEAREPEELQPRPRPNAMAIIERRQSLQTINHVLEMGAVSTETLRRLSTYSNPGQPEGESPSEPALQPLPNFSSSHGAVRRHSFSRPPGGLPSTQTTPPPLPARMSASRRPPPTALFINPRPLSLVEDQPSPALSPLSRSGTAMDGGESPRSGIPLAPPVTLPSPQWLESEMGRRIRDESIRDSGISTNENTSDQPTSPCSANRHSKDDSDLLTRGVPALEVREMPRWGTTWGAYGESRPAGQISGKPRTRSRGLSFNSRDLERSRALSPPPLKPMPRSAQQLRPDPPQPHMVPRQRSMSHLAAEGPPLAPPPNRALPPIPQKLGMNAPPPGFI